MGLLASISLQSAEDSFHRKQVDTLSNGIRVEREEEKRDGFEMRSIYFSSNGKPSTQVNDEWDKAVKKSEMARKNQSILPSPLMCFTVATAAGIYYCCKNPDKVQPWFNSLSTTASNWWSNLFLK